MASTRRSRTARQQTPADAADADQPEDGRAGTAAATPRTAAAAAPTGTPADDTQTTTTPRSSPALTMAERALRRYLAAQNESSSGSSSSNGADNAHNPAGKKRRRSARSSGGFRSGGKGGSDDDPTSTTNMNSHDAGVDYHRVRTARLTRLEEMFWRDDAGYDTEDDDTDDADNDDDNDDDAGDEEDDDDNDGQANKGEENDSSGGDWRLVRRLPLDTWLRCDGNGCRRKAVATWAEVEAPAATEEAKREGGRGEGADDAPEGTEQEQDKDKEEDKEEEEEWHVCLGCQKREFADHIGPKGWPSYHDAVPVATATDEGGATAKPPVHLNYGRRLHLTRIHDSPHIYIMDDFLTESELKHIDGKIAHAESNGTFAKSFVDKGDGHHKKQRQKKRRRKREKTVANNGGHGDDEGQVGDDDGGGEEKKEEDEDDNGGGDDGGDKPGDDGGNDGAAAAAAKTKDDGHKRQTTDERQRTSRFIHFGKMADAKIAAIEARAAELLQLPHASIEPLQLVRYGPGQYFREHHDMGVLFDDGSVELPPRVLAGVPRRVVTILVYLNDLPIEAGGGTQFPYLSKTGFGMKDDDDEDEDDGGGGIVIHPKRGRAVVWANIDQTGWPDPRTVHEGMPLIRGAKMPSATAKAAKKKEAKKEKAPKKEKKPKPKKAKKPRKSKKKAAPPPRPPTDQILRYIVVPRSDPTNPLSSFGMKVAAIGPDGRTVLTTDWEHPHMAQRLGLQLGRLKKDDVILSVNGHKVFDPVTEKVLLPFRVVVALIRATKPGRAMKLDVLRYAPKVKVEEQVKTDESGTVVDGSAQPDAAVSNEDTDTAIDDVKAEDCNDDGKAKVDEVIEKVKSGVEKTREEDAQVKEEPESEPKLEPDTPKAKPLPLLKYAMNIWACEE